jgi:hypothetical protein
LLRAYTLWSILAVLALGALCAPAASAQTLPTPLLVGSVRDQRGEPLDAEVTLVGTEGQELGHDQTQSDGTFAIVPRGKANAVVVHCRFCAPTRRLIDGQGSVIIIVPRYTALAERFPDERDMEALPYADLADTLALAPYILPSSDQGDSSVSDRGLDGGNALILDDGIPVYNLADGYSGLDAMPSRYTGEIGFGEPNRAFTYGNYAGGGTFSITPRTETSSAALDIGRDADVSAHLESGKLFAAAGSSKNADGLVRRRGDLSYDADMAGGRLDIGLAAMSSLGDATASANRYADREHIAYATASRKYRTFVSFGSSTASSALAASGAQPATHSSSLFTSVRVEHPGPVTLTYGALSQRSTGAYDTASTGRLAEDLVYAEGRTDGRRTSIDAGASLSHIDTARSIGTQQQRISTQIGLASFAAQTALGRWFDLHADASTSMRVPTLAQTYPQASAQNAFALERSTLIETALSFQDARRIHAQTSLFRETEHGFEEQRVQGLGLSFSWQIAPLVAVRAWTLRSDMGETPERSVLWSTYDNPSGIRVDAIVYRDGSAGGKEVALDGDIVIPLPPRLRLSVGTRRTNQTRCWSIGARY